MRPGSHPVNRPSDSNGCVTAIDPLTCDPIRRSPLGDGFRVALDLHRMQARRHARPISAVSPTAICPFIAARPPRSLPVTPFSGRLHAYTAESAGRTVRGRPGPSSLAQGDRDGVSKTAVNFMRARVLPPAMMESVSAGLLGLVLPWFHGAVDLTPRWLRSRTPSRSAFRCRYDAAAGCGRARGIEHRVLLRIYTRGVGRGVEPPAR